MHVTGFLYTPISVSDELSPGSDTENNISKTVNRIFQKLATGKIDENKGNSSYVSGLLILDISLSHATVKEITRTILRLKLIFPQVDVKLNGDHKTIEYVNIKTGNMESNSGDHTLGKQGLQYFQDVYFPLNGNKKPKNDRKKIVAIMEALNVDTIEGLIYGFLDLEQFQKILILSDVGSYFISFNFLPHLIDYCYRSNIRLRRGKIRIESEEKIKPGSSIYQKYNNTIWKRKQLEDAVS